MAIQKNQSPEFFSIIKNAFLNLSNSPMPCKKISFLLLVTGSYLLSCQSNNSRTNNTDSSTGKTHIIKQANYIPLVRKDIKKDPVDQYEEKTDDRLNDWRFSVKLYETPKTFNYLIEMQFEEVQGEDTLRLPNLGNLPKPVLKKGEEKYSCVVGFIDNENKFREYKLVHVEKGNLKITPLKHYSVSSYQ
jgi:hypothetical protein